MKPRRKLISAPVDFLSASGFILEIKGVWYLATAGHFFEDVTKLRNKYPGRKFTFWMADSFGTPKDSDMFILLHFDYLPKFHRYDEDSGIDFGLVGLDSNTRSLLQKGNRVPVHEEHWRNWDALKFFGFRMVGIPYEFLQPKPRSLMMKAAMLPIKLLDKPPERLKRHTEPMLYAELVDLGGISSIKGMSGCPVFGFTVNNDEIAYFIVAIQSGWLPEREPKIIYAFMLPTLVKELIKLADDESAIDPHPESAVESKS